jgi:hypothetical protein
MSADRSVAIQLMSRDKVSVPAELTCGHLGLRAFWQRPRTATGSEP